MFLEYYGLREQPFGVTPDPRFLYFGATHREALASLFYGIESGCGFMALIAPPGMGKTTLLFHLLEKLRGSAQTVFLFQTQCGSRELFRHLLSDLGIDSAEQDLAAMHQSLNSVLLSNARKGRRVVLVIDEAQNLKNSVLETVRLLSDFETPQNKLLQIVLSGQPQLADKLSHPVLTQLRQRISVIGRLHPFTRVETMVYLEYRLCKAGYSGPPLFSYGAVDLIAANSKGIPRTINNLCFNALTLGFAKRQKQIDAITIREVMADFDLEGLSADRSPVPGVSEDALSSFDGISPSNELTYQDFHDAVRVAWGNGAPLKSEDKPAVDSPKLPGTNGKPHSVDAVFRMSLQPEGTARTPIELHDPQEEDDAKNLGSSRISSGPQLGLADGISSQAQRDESRSAQSLTQVAVAEAAEPVAEPSIIEHQPTQLEIMNAFRGSLVVPTMPVTSSWLNIKGKLDFAVLSARCAAGFQTLRDFFKNREGIADKARAIRGGTLIAVVVALTVGGLAFAWRYPEFVRTPPNAVPVSPSPVSVAPWQPAAAFHASHGSQARPDKVSAAPAKGKHMSGQRSARNRGHVSPEVTPETQVSNPESKTSEILSQRTQPRLSGQPVHSDTSTPSSGEVLNRAEEKQ
jgi:general secretion pathway protein A